MMILRHRFVENIPEEIPFGELFISVKYKTAVHKCVCGCNNEVVTPFSPTDWKLIFDGATVSLSPSIGNWNFECRSHYWITRNKVVHSYKWSNNTIVEGRNIDMKRKDEFFSSKKDNRQLLTNMLPYHECSHVILAHLFSEYLNLEFVSLSPSETLDYNSLAGTVAGTKVTPKRFDLEGNDARTITFLAGFIGQNIYLMGREEIQALKEELLNDPDLFNKELCGGDLQLFSMEVGSNAKAHDMKEIDYQKFCLGFLIDFLCDKKIWEFVEKLVSELKNQTSQTLKKDQIEAIFHRIGLDEYLNQRKAILFQSLGFSASVRVRKS